MQTCVECEQWEWEWMNDDVVLLLLLRRGKKVTTCKAKGPT